MADRLIDFDREIRPILSENCYHCHGPDETSRQADLRLDTQDGLLSNHLTSPGDADASELFKRINSTDDDLRMPPADSNLQLTSEQIQLIQSWINQGATWKGHWAFQSITRPDVPETDDPWARNPIDHFVLHRMHQSALKPNPQANKEQLLRRVKFDLTGFPPTIEELDQFLADESSQAYSTMVNRFLESPHYGERMAWNWLDIARYADTNGYQGDRVRTMWPWRDWVVNTFNQNKPYDQFTIEQLAGDLLPNSTVEQKLATGFCRNHMINGEGGRIPEENRIEYIFDQTETMGTVWLGLTLTCSRCHDHKYDPLSQREYYQLFDYFNQTPVNGAGGNPQMPPNLSVPTPEQQSQIATLQQTIHKLHLQQTRRQQELEPQRLVWEQLALEQLKDQDSPWRVLQPVKLEAEHQTLTLRDDYSILASGENPPNDSYQIHFQTDLQQLHAIRLDALRHSTMTQNGLARSDSGNFVLTEISCSILRADGSRQTVNITSAVATYEQGVYKITNSFDGNRRTGWAVLKGRFVDRDHAGLFYFDQPVELTTEDQVVVTLKHDSVHQQHNLGHFQISATAQPNATIEQQDLTLRNALLTSTEQRTAEQRQLLNQRFLKQDPTYQQLAKQLTESEQQLSNIKKQIPVVMVMQDQAQRRETLILEKGIYNKPLDSVLPGLPAALQVSAADPDQPQNRLTLARWLVDPSHPLTARVTVNRYWQLLFGKGLVKTPEDFGAQGAKPSHPELLDWLAAEFIESGWDLKHLIRLMVTSATYQQSASVSTEKLEADPENVLLSRGPRFRLHSWMLRDQALYLSGLLVDRPGGPPVSPYQPEGIWAEATFGKTKYQQDTGDNLYRRTLYTFWRRIVGPTMLFDNSPRQSCSVSVYRTNTPLHALVTLNDITYVEAARAFAQRLLLSHNDEPQRIQMALRMATSRTPTYAEIEILDQRLKLLKAHYSQNPDAATELLQVGDSKADQTLDPIEHASWTGLCSLILNLDETLCH